MSGMTFLDEIEQTPINVARAALRLAREIAYPGIDVDEYMDRLEGIAAAARAAIPPEDPPLIQAEALADFLFVQSGFHGNEQEYSDPRNSYLNEVLDRQLGIPISLSVLYVEVARRIDLTANGVGMPGHFIVSAQDISDTIYLDPFHKGVRLYLDDCTRLVRLATGYDGPFRKEWLNPTQPKDILARMLNNLRNTYVTQESWTEALLVVAHLQQVQPDQPAHYRDKGLLHYRNGSMHLALKFLEEYLRRAPDAPDAESIRTNLGGALAKWIRLN